MRNLMFLVLLAGCGGSDASNTDPITSQQNGCPVEQPENGDACSFTVAFCHYPDACTPGYSLDVMCQDGKASVLYNLVAALCPSQVPAEGEDCPCSTGGRQQQPCRYSCDGFRVQPLSVDLGAPDDLVVARCENGKWTRSVPLACDGPDTKR
jgi:hypothetical protein